MLFHAIRLYVHLVIWKTSIVTTMRMVYIYSYTMYENCTSTTKKFNPDNRSVSTLIAWYLEAVPNSLDLHSLSEVLQNSAAGTFSWVVIGLVYPNRPMRVLICCYAMRSNIFKPCWTTSHLGVGLHQLPGPDDTPRIRKSLGIGQSAPDFDTVPHDLSVAHRMQVQSMLA